MSYAEGTTVSPIRSQQEIRKILDHYGKGATVVKMARLGWPVPDAMQPTEGQILRPGDLRAVP